MSIYLDTIMEKIISGYEINKEEAFLLLKEPLPTLQNMANFIREFFCGNYFDTCTISNGKSGKCSENCKFCSQSINFKTNILEYPLLNTKKLISHGINNFNKGILRYSIVSSGKKLSNEEVDEISHVYRELSKKNKGLLCASHGLLHITQLKKLKDSGVSRYHNNLETSEIFFPKICTTHTFEDKILTIKNAQKVGLEVCSGGIFGLGETMEDRIDMLLKLRELKVTSIPLNILNPISGTDFSDNIPLTQEDIISSFVLARFILPKAVIRMAGGRNLISLNGEVLLKSGVNGMITGDMLTTSSSDISSDIQMISRNNFKLKTF